ncbi:hypothetical protein NDU88_006996 [Pleurodeles waltl]|uniref:Secreted protein n=1 Tax=Pleurodeles waltl TaxID=8319 RepID=A0AAV7N0X5_PLEWA|nr:hypothetical protein NDU88_006996 [Pleurodeles waltl]
MRLLQSVLARLLHLSWVTAPDLLTTPTYGKALSCIGAQSSYPGRLERRQRDRYLRTGIDATTAAPYQAKPHPCRRRFPRPTEGPGSLKSISRKPFLPRLTKRVKEIRDLFYAAGYHFDVFSVRPVLVDLALHRVLLI